MTYTWSPAIKEPLESNVWAQRFDDFMLNWVVTGLTPSNGGSGILDIAAGTCYIDGWRVVTDGETHDISSPDGLRWVYIELSKDGSGKVTSITEADYASEQTEDVRILIAKPTVASGLITDVGDVRQYDVIDSSLIKLDTDISLSDWRHASDVTKIDGGDIYAGTILNATIGAAADIVASKILIDGTTQLSNWRHTSDLATFDAANIYDGSITNAKITAAAGIPYSKLTLTDNILNADINSSAAIAYSKLNLTTSIMNADINGSAAIAYSKLDLSTSIVNADIAGGAAIAWSKIAVDGNVTYDDVAETITAAWSIRGTHLNFHDGAVDCGDILASGTYFILRDGAGQNILSFGQDSTRLKSYASYDIELIAASGDIILKNSGGTRFRVVGGTIWSDVVHYTHGIMPATGCNYNIGSDALRYATVFTDFALDVGNCDVAEWMPGEEGKPGDVYILEDSGMLVKCNKDNDPNAIGVFTTDPGVIMGNQSHRFGMTTEDWREFNIPLAMAGVVPVKVSGKVKPTDYLITSSKTGYARTIQKKDNPPFFVLGRATTHRSAVDKTVMMYIETQVLYHHPLKDT